MIALITGVVGIISTILAYNFGPGAAKRKIIAELESIYKELEKLYARRDKALQTHDNDELTIANSLIIKLCSRKTILFQRLG